VEKVIKKQGDLPWPIAPASNSTNEIYAMAVDLITSNFTINSSALTPIAAKKKGLPYKDRGKECEDVLNSLT
jgi:hypothetical protein